MAEKSHGWMPRELSPGNYSKGPGNVRIRWRPYIEYVQPRFDMHEKIIDRLKLIEKLTGNEELLDIGSGDASFLVDLRHLYGHNGKLTGLEPNLEQLEGDEDWGPDSPPLEKLYDMRDINIVKGIAQDMPFADKTFDGGFARRMMYEIPKNEQHQVMQEIKRVLKNDGFFVLTTSGYFNKLEHRKFENLIAAYLGIEAPPLMNASYTAQRAEVELPKYFKNVTTIRQDGAMIFRSFEQAEDYYLSIATMQDQFDPIPNLGTLREAINKIVRKEIEESISITGDFREPIELVGFICWD